MYLRLLWSAFTATMGICFLLERAEGAPKILPHYQESMDRDPWNNYYGPQIVEKRDSSGKTVPGEYIMKVCVLWEEAKKAEVKPQVMPIHCLQDPTSSICRNSDRIPYSFSDGRSNHSNWIYTSRFQPRFCQLAEYVTVISKEKTIEIAQGMDLLGQQSTYLQMDSRDKAINESINSLTLNQISEQLKNEIRREILEEFYSGDNYERLKQDLRKEIINLIKAGALE